MKKMKALDVSLILHTTAVLTSMYFFEIQYYDVAKLCILVPFALMWPLVTSMSHHEQQKIEDLEKCKTRMLYLEQIYLK